VGISLKTHKLLWGKSGNRCAICKTELIEALDSTISGSEGIIGEECHIVARKREGPRGISELSLEDRDEIGNLILLCSNHHREIDTKVEKYSVQGLKEIKRDHEDWVKKTLEINIDEDQLLMIQTIDSIIEKAQFDEWSESFIGITYDDNYFMDKKYFESLGQLKYSLFNRFRISKYLFIENEVDNFYYILHDFLKVFSRYIDYRNENDQQNRLFTKKFYKINYYDEESYNKLGNEYDFHCHLLEDLVFELTKSANRIVEMVREHLVKGYRQVEGNLILHRGMDINHKEYSYMPVYASSSEYYPRLELFSKAKFKERQGIVENDNYIKEYL